MPPQDTSSLESSGQRPSLWLAQEKPRRYSQLESDVSAEVCIVGGGIAGMTAAYLLSREGSSVVLLEEGRVGSGETGRTTAHLSTAIDDGYVEIERIHGAETAKRVAESHAAAIDRIERTVLDERLDCDFERVDGYLILSPGRTPELLAQELAAAKRAGLSDVELLAAPPLPGAAPPCLRFPRQAQLHPMKYLLGLADAAARQGVRLYTGTRVAEVHDGAPPQVRTDRGHGVVARYVIVATNTPISDRVAIHTKQAAYRTYVLAAEVPRGAIPRALYWDTADPYHYVRLQPFTRDADLLIVGGEDHKTGQVDDPERRHSRLEAWARIWFPMMGPVRARWSGQVMESIDGLGYIGRSLGDVNVYIATGDSGMGMTHGTIAGLLLTDLIAGRRSPWTAVYDPGRVRPGALAGFARENVNMAAQYGAWLTSSEVKSVDEIPRGQGAVLRDGGRKIAVYRDEAGRIVARSAVCPHLGCIVTWNAAERTWDCPCHGSRFDAHGAVLNGPANTGLEDAGPTKRSA